MAGYDFEIQYHPNLDKEGRLIFKLLQFVAGENQIRFKYRFLKKKQRVYTTVDGTLERLQAFAAKTPSLLSCVALWIKTEHGLKKVRQLSKLILGPLLTANREGLQANTTSVHEMVEFLGQHDSDARVVGIVQDFCVDRAVRRSASRRIKSAYKTIHGIHRDYLTDAFNPKHTAILLDQALEDILKAKLEIAGSSKIPFPLLLGRALYSGFITESEKKQIDSFHKYRKGVQHGGKDANKPRSRKFLYFMVEYEKRIS